MIVLKEIREYDNELQMILSLAAKALEDKFNTNKELLKLYGSAFEKQVCDTLNIVSTGYAFYNKFEQASSHAFPDLYAKIMENKWFGVEVKTSQGDWKCFGNSIFETTRVPNLDDRIYVFFGKFSSSLECKWSKYEECIDNINITHSPRYQINMDIKGYPSLSVFNKMNTTYLEFYNAHINQRMEFVREFKRQGVGQDIALWWLPDHESPNQDDEEKLLIKLFSSLESSKKDEIRYTAMALFPEVFSKSAHNKYSRLPTWLASQYGVVMGNIRDLFTAGGQFDVNFKGGNYKIPKIGFHLYNGANQIKKIIYETNQDEIISKWSIIRTNIPNNSNDKLELWIDVVTLFLKEQNTMPKNFPLKDWLRSLLDL